MVCMSLTSLQTALLDRFRSDVQNVRRPTCLRSVEEKGLYKGDGTKENGPKSEKHLELSSRLTMRLTIFNHCPIQSCEVREIASTPTPIGVLK